ncbi:MULTISPECIES: TonB-dependent siderophore receptor [Cyanophyceae]|uniref:TonB-dependent siderophore receptor n=1 Tax=Cyanophyceae TaxID=3028117 RepID=UPI001689EB74|nr:MULTISPECIES: TonB-dependent siderophore receptor [Cyanophyceae]MBD1918269.1 TonB-dependent siderophore receptor [Phormidium sp. FACHB-77]MBD2031313.1 TonB-dependent siderophore receptor [Phormidium sp. FACHB-322]MBD2052380.1 TonB-dependent siderophore receptor [Leptolyngbya sp. FACHB-60]
MGVRLQRLVLLAGWLALVPMAAQAETTLSLAEVAQPSSQAADLNLAQGATQITGVRVEGEGAGLRLVLDAIGPLAEPTTSVVGNALVVDIPNAVLALPEGESFEQFGPAEGIALVSVTSLEDNRVRVSITGSDGPPAVNVSTEAAGLVLGITPGLSLTSGEEEVIRIGVTGEGDEGYDPRDSSTATRTDTPLRDIPQSIQVIPQAVIEDRDARELGNALETAGSVADNSGRGLSVFGPGFLIRGFENRGGVFRDGVEAVSLGGLSTNDIERVEVLRGPASVLFGQGEPGGIINLVPKRPLSEPFYDISAGVDSFGSYDGAVDLSGPITDDSALRYRLNVSYENLNSFRNLVDGNRLLISPIITWDISPSTSLDVYGQYTSDRETIDEGLVVGANGIIDLPRDRFLGEDFGEFSQDQFNLGYRLNHEISENLDLRHTLQYQQYSPRRYAPLFDSLDETTGELGRLAYFAGGKYQRFFTNAEAVGRFSTGSVNHEVLFGVEYRNTLEQPEFQFSNSYNSINIFNPVYTGIPYAIEPEFFRDDTIRTLGIYLQDQVEILPNLNLLAGIRYDTADQFRTTQDIGQPREEFSQSDSAFSPRVGIVYQPIEPVSLYASYTTSFQPSFGASRNADDSTFDPERGRQFEVGVKGDITDSLSFTAALFDIRRRNVRTPDPNNRLFTVQTGEVTSRGFELGLGGEVLPGWNLTANYTSLDAFVSKDNSTQVGNSLANVPDNQFSLWSTYEMQEGSLEGLGFGLGLYYVSQRAGNSDNSFTLPSYFRTDAALFYRRDNWRAQLNVENLFNSRYFTSSDQFLGVNPGAPLTVSARVGVEF